jgi:hypothetical protein
MIKPSKLMLTNTIQNSIKNVLISIGASTTIYLVLIIGSPQEQFLINGSLQGVFFVIGLPQGVFLGLPSAAPSPPPSMWHCNSFLISIFFDWQKKRPLQLSSICKSRYEQNIFKKNFKLATLHVEVVP